jgi:hypothetical protein
MRRIDERTVEMDERELAVVAVYEALLNEGEGIVAAAKRAFDGTERGHDHEFVRYLRDEEPDRIDGPEFATPAEARAWVMCNSMGSVWQHDDTFVRIEAEGHVFVLELNFETDRVRWEAAKRTA